MELSFKNYYYRWLKSLVFLFFLFVCFLTLARIGFVFYFGEWNTLKTEVMILLKAMFLGVRYDLMPIAYINLIPFFLLHLAYFISNKKIIRMIRLSTVFYLCFGYFTLAWIYLCDYGFYSYFQDHINILFFGLFEDDTVAVLISIWKNYNLPLWLSIFFVFHYGFYRFVRLLFSLNDFDLKVKKNDYKVLMILVTGLVSLSFMGRGNFTRLPLSIEDAHISSNEFINKISINGAVALNRAIKLRRTYGSGGYNYLSSFAYKKWQEAFIDAKGITPLTDDLKNTLFAKTSKDEILEKNPPHVVMVVMESHGTYWNHRNGPGFNVLGDLEKHFREGVLFNNFLPAENGTIGSFISIATSQIIRPGGRFLSESEFMKTSLSSAGHIPFKEKGYDTHFVYGGKLGWRDLGKYLSAQSYDFLWGSDEIKEAMPELSNLSLNELGNEWGIFDEYLYSFIEEKIKTSKKPQFFLVLTTSNHPPFEFPASYQTLPIDLNQDFLEKLTVDEELARKRFFGLQYANQKMGEFLTRVRNSPKSEQVVVALTGDHSYWITKSVGLDQEFKRYAVPFFLSLPGHLKPTSYDSERFGSHEDIFPTLYHLTLSNQQYIKFGENLLGEEGIAQNSSGIVANKYGAYHHDRYWKWKDLKNLILEETQKTPELLKLKKHREGLISIVDLYLKSEKSHKRSSAKNDRPE